MRVQVNLLLVRNVDKAMISGNDKRCPAAPEFMQQAFETGIQFQKVPVRGLTADTFLMGQRVEAGPVSIDVFLIRPRPHDLRNLGEALIETPIGQQLGTTEVRAVEIGPRNPVGAKRVAFYLKAVKDGHVAQQPLGADPRATERLTAAARRERQHGQHAAQFPEPGEPAREAVLLRRETGQEGRDRGRRGGRRHRCDRALKVLMQHAALAASNQVVVAQAVDDEQHQVVCVSKLIRCKFVQHRIIRTMPAIGACDRTHQIHDAAATVIREYDVAHFRGFRLCLYLHSDLDSVSRNRVFQPTRTGRYPCHQNGAAPLAREHDTADPPGASDYRR